MPTISMFYGITIKMFFSDHNPPHIHAVYGEYNCLFDIQKLEVIEGDLPRRAIDLVKEWAVKHQTELLKIWEKHEYFKIPGLK